MHLMAVNVIVEVIIDLINSVSNNGPIQAELLLLDYCHGVQVSVCAEMLGASSPLRTPLTYISIVFCMRQWEKWFHNQTQYLGVIQHDCC